MDNNSNRENRDQLKRNFTLDLSPSVIKKIRPNNSLVTPNNRLELLSSPDLHMLKLGSPEIERLILQQNITISTPNQHFFQESEEEEGRLQEALSRLQKNSYIADHRRHGEYAQAPFIKSEYVLQHGQVQGQGQGGGVGVGAYNPAGQQPSECSEDWGDDTSSMSSSMSSKEDPQIVPTNPIDMISQEKIKLERKRMRNRMAASKCRKRKLERIAKLEEKVRQIRVENGELGEVAKRLRETVGRLREEIGEHKKVGCSFPYM